MLCQYKWVKTLDLIYRVLSVSHQLMTYWQARKKLVFSCIPTMSGRNCDFLYIFFICFRTRVFTSPTRPVRVQWDTRILCYLSARLFNISTINYEGFLSFYRERGMRLESEATMYVLSLSGIILKCKIAGQKWCEKHQESKGKGRETWQNRADCERKPGQY